MTAWLLATLGCGDASLTASPVSRRASADAAQDAGASRPDASAFGGASFDDAYVLAGVMGNAYRQSGEFTHASRAPYPSTAAEGSNIDVWVTSTSLAQYTKISPTATGSRASVAPGTIIVRVVSNASGAVTKITLMAKGPKGYNPAIGDWWFGETDPEGLPLREDGGAALVGKLDACYSCHLARASDDFLFGVPPADRHP